MPLSPIFSLDTPASVVRGKRRTRTRDRHFLPGRRTRDEEGYTEKTIGRLPAPPEGQIYRVEEGADGSWMVILCTDDGVDELLGETTVGDRLFGPNPKLAAMNKCARAHWAGRTADKQNMLLRFFTTVEGERLELVGPDEKGGYSLILISPDQPEITANTPLGADGQGPTIRQSSPPSRSGDRGYRRTEAGELHQMNLAARRFWR